MQDIDAIISKSDALMLLEIIFECALCADIQDAQAIMQKTNSLLDFSSSVYGLARLNNNGSVTQYETINFSYPSEWIDIYKTNRFHEIDPIILDNFSNFGLQYWADTYKKCTVDKDFISMSQEFNLLNGYACGTTNHSRTEGCILSLAGNMIKHPRNDYILFNLSSHLHVAFSNVLRRRNNPKTLLQISTRETEVLNWVKRGKSTWEISIILHISERTVKFHIDNVLKKLDAVSRPHAVAIALATGLIGFD